MEVNIRDVIQQKSPKAARWIPGFVFRYLHRILHVDEVNRYLREFEDLDSIGFARATLREMGIEYQSAGMERLNRDGRYLFASNHPFGGVDGLMIADEVHKYFGSVKLVVNDLLTNLAPLKSLFIPINKHGRQSAENLKTFQEAFESEMPIVTFPAGLCSRFIDKQVQDVEWKQSFIKQAISSQRDVVPVFFDGELSKRFYRLYRCRTWMGLKINIEMLFLVDEMFKQGGSRFTMYIGEPIRWREFENGERPAVWAGRVREAVYNLKPSSEEGK